MWREVGWSGVRRRCEWGCVRGEEYDGVGAQDRIGRMVGTQKAICNTKYPPRNIGRVKSLSINPGQLATKFVRL